MYRETRVSFTENGMFQLTKGGKIVHSSVQKWGRRNRVVWVLMKRLLMLV